MGYGGGGGASGSESEESNAWLRNTGLGRPPVLPVEVLGCGWDSAKSFFLWTFPLCFGGGVTLGGTSWFSGVSGVSGSSCGSMFASMSAMKSSTLNFFFSGFYKICKKC